MRLTFALLISAAVLLVSADANAGTHGGGIKGGLLVSSPSGADKDAYKVESLNTLSFGAFYRYTFSNMFSLQAEALYAHRGSKGEYYSNEGKIHIWYLDLVPLLQCRVLDRSSFFSDLYFGPMCSLRLDAKFEGDFGGTTHFYDIESSIKPTDYGIVVGAKLGLAKASNELGVDVRYSWGFVAPDDTEREIDLKNRTLTAMIELYF